MSTHQSRILKIVLVCIFGCFCATSLFVRQVHFDASQFSHYTARFVEIITCFVIAFLARKNRIGVARLFWVGAFASFMYLLFEYGILLTSISPTEQNLLVIYGLSGVFYGISLACLFLLFMRCFAYYPPQHAAIMIPSGFALSHLIFLSSYFVPTTVLPWLKSVLLVVSVVLLQVILKALFSDESIHSKSAPQRETISFLSIFKINKYFSLYFGMLVFPFFYGLMAQICSFENISSGLFDISTEVVGIVFLCFLALSGLLWKHKYDPGSIFTILLPIFATALLFFPFFWDSEVFVSGFIMKCGFLIYSSLMWMYLQRTVYYAPNKTFLFFGLASGFYHLALMAGRFMAFLFTTYTVIADDTIAVASLLAIWLLSMAALIFIVSNRVKKGDSGNAEVPLDIFAANCEVFAEEYGLSERELEILKEYARGRSVNYIAQHSVVAQETVKTYLKRIYTKSNCHSRQELIDKIEKKR